MKTSVPIAITFLVGTSLVVAIFVPHAPFSTLNEHLSVWFNILACFAFALGGGNLLKTHLKKIAARERDWQYSVVTLGGFLVMLVAGLFKLGAPSWDYDYIGRETWFKRIYDATFTPLQATMFSLLAFFVASASYRAFRAKTREATLLLVAAVVILLGRTPLGYILTAWLPEPLAFLQISNLSTWILGVPNLAGQRAILIGIALGIISSALKLILGIERSHLGGGRDA
jgi:hypothetical protein